MIRIESIGSGSTARAWLLGWCLVLLSFSVYAGAPSDGPGWEEMNSTGQATLLVPLYKSKLIRLDREATKVSVGNPEIADILVLEPKKVYVVGKALGTTNLLVVDSSGQVSSSIDIEVTHDIEGLKAKLYELFPEEAISVHASQGSIVLGGEVSSIEKMNAAMELARTFMPLSRGLDKTKGKEEIEGNKVINLMEVGGAQQVMLEVKVAEISRQLLKRMDMNFNLINPSTRFKLGAVSGGASFPDAVFKPGDYRIPAFPVDGGPIRSTPIGPMLDEYAPNDLTIQDKGMFLSFLSKRLLFNGVLDIAKEKGLAKILAEPTLTTLTGQKAKFISGGEFPMPVPQGVNGVTIAFKEYGVGLEFLPVVLGSDKINLDLNISVSELTDTGSVTLGEGSASRQYFVPALTKRSASSSVELANGQTLGIAGLISENLRESLNKFPGLGDLPVLGPLFRSQSYLKGQTELVIFVTPHFARPIAKELVKLPTDDFVEPDDTEFYLMGRLEGRKKPEMAKFQSNSGGAEGVFGHQL